MIRREFIKSSALAAGTLVTPFPFPLQNQKVKLGILGTGWWGTDIILATALASKQYEIVALCDVNSVALERAANNVEASGSSKPKLFESYREMYEVSGLEAVAIATPTHWHALQFIDACNKGLDVFLEKPISYDIREAQAMLEAHKRAKNVVVVDFPRVMVDTNDKVKRIIESGEVGNILQVKANIINHEGPLVEKPIPDTIDYDTFCGPVPKQTYLCNQNSDNPNWRGQFQFSRGIMMDWGIHYIHNARLVLNLDLPDSVSAIGGTTKNHSSDNPDHLDVRYEFGGLPVCWSHKTWGYTSPNPNHNIGVYYYGEKGTIFAGDLGWEIYPAGGGAKQVTGNVAFNPGTPENAEKYQKMLLDMFLEFAEGVRNNSNSGITNKLEDAYKTTTSVIYGDMAFRVKSGLEINKSTMDVENNKAAQAMLRREYQAPYQHPYLT